MTLSVDLIISDHIGIGMAQLILHQHVYAVSEINPPGLSISLFNRPILAIYLERRLLRLVKRMRLM